MESEEPIEGPLPLPRDAECAMIPILRDPIEALSLDTEITIDECYF